MRAARSAMLPGRDADGAVLLPFLSPKSMRWITLCSAGRNAAPGGKCQVIQHLAIE